MDEMITEKRVELISKLKMLHVGKQTWKARCPFHNEQTPSFVIDFAHDRFHCFGCGVSGTTDRLRSILPEEFDRGR